MGGCFDTDPHGNCGSGSSWSLMRIQDLDKDPITEGNIINCEKTRIAGILITQQTSSQGTGNLIGNFLPFIINQSD